jgi:hypothetical protein
MREKEEWERAREETVQVFNIKNIQVYNTSKKTSKNCLKAYLFRPSNGS